MRDNKRGIVYALAISILIHLGIVILVFQDNVPKTQSKKITWVSVNQVSRGKQLGGQSQGSIPQKSEGQGTGFSETQKNLEQTAGEDTRRSDTKGSKKDKGSTEQDTKNDNLTQKIESREEPKKKQEKVDQRELSKSQKIKEQSKNRIDTNKSRSASQNRKQNTKTITKKEKTESRKTLVKKESVDTKGKSNQSNKFLSQSRKVDTKQKNRRAEIKGSGRRELVEVSPRGKTQSISPDEIDKRIKELYSSYSGKGDGKGEGEQVGGVSTGNGDSDAQEQIKLAYIEIVSSMVKNHYEIPPFFKNLRLACVVYVSILKDGKLEEVRLETSSGNQSFDSFVLKIVQDSAPFPPPPVEIKFLIRFSTYE
ncbi:MAG: cell envelope integrity protein TolA [bacterium]|nr:cell envelope integrity protein TolA [bacterium]